MNKQTNEKCIICKNTFVPDTITPEYGIDNHGHKICFVCCGKIDMKRFKTAKVGDKDYLYYNHETNTISNFPGTFKIAGGCHTHGKHNIARTRIDIWFKVGDTHFHGVQYGENTQILHTKCVKGDYTK